MDKEHVQGLEQLRAEVCKELGKETGLSINSGFRCKTYNAKIGGATDSVHTHGRASDVRTPKGLTDERFAELAERVPMFRNGGIGIYEGNTC